MHCLLGIIGTLLIALAARWTWLFTATTYRHDHALTMLLLAKLAFGLGILLWGLAYWIAKRKRINLQLSRK